MFKVKNKNFTEFILHYIVKCQNIVKLDEFFICVQQLNDLIEN